MGNKVRISQCMIVKDEEKNIEKALSWGKGVVCEQIVVDTGSTDRTVEIAQQMGAKIYHYEWNNDFAAAKNYALEQASGNWIAFLDADEYFTPKDAKGLKKYLENLTSQNIIADLVTCPLLNLDGDGRIFSTTVQQRVFQNTPLIRYKNRIHENLFRTDGKMLTEVRTDTLFPIYHTGYTSSAYEEKDKVIRNKDILINILKENPEDYDNLSYLGDVYVIGNELEKAKEVYREVIAHYEELTLAPV
ncbi:MAG: glycosyltransferase family 2 protein [Muricomes sp.]